MNRLMPKNTTASHLVLLDRKLDAPRAPNTVPEAPAPKPEPAAAPAPRCSRISTIMAIATSTYTTLRISISIVRVSLTAPPQRPGQWPGNRRPPGRRRRSARSEEHTSELQSRENLVCRLLLE